MNVLCYFTIKCYTYFIIQTCFLINNGPTEERNFIKMNEKMITILTDETIKIWERFFFLINEVNENHNSKGEIQNKIPEVIQKDMYSLNVFITIKK